MSQKSFLNKLRNQFFLSPFKGNHVIEMHTDSTQRYIQIVKISFIRKKQKPYMQVKSKVKFEERW